MDAGEIHIRFAWEPFFERNSTLRGRKPGIVNTKSRRNFLGIGAKAIGDKNLNQ